MNNSGFLQKMPIKLGHTKMSIVMGLTEEASLMCFLHDGGQNLNQSNDTIGQ